MAVVAGKFLIPTDITNPNDLSSRSGLLVDWGLGSKTNAVTSIAKVTFGAGYASSQGSVFFFYPTTTRSILPPTPADASLLVMPSFAIGREWIMQDPRRVAEDAENSITVNLRASSRNILGINSGTLGLAYRIGRLSGADFAANPLGTVTWLTPTRNATNNWRFIGGAISISASNSVTVTDTFTPASTADLNDEKLFMEVALVVTSLSLVMDRIGSADIDFELNMNTVAGDNAITTPAYYSHPSQKNV